MRLFAALLLRPIPRSHVYAQQCRAKSDWMPREKYAKITGLDKLHRRQRLADRKERQDSHDRAQKMNLESLPQSPPPRIETESLNKRKLTPTISPLPYHITRTPSSNLPIYQTSKAGGSKHITSIRKITGDLNELAEAVRSALGLQRHVVDVKGRTKETVTINHVTRQVVVRGWRGPEIKKWAELVGF